MPGARIAAGEGQPARNPLRVGLVLGAEGAAQMAFLIKDDERLKARPKDNGVDGQGEALKRDCPARNNRQHTDIHRIARIAVKASHHKLLRCVDGGGGAAPERGEIPHAPDIGGSACCHEAESEQQCADRSDRPSLDEQERHVHGNGAGYDNREEDVLEKEDQRRSLPVLLRISCRREFIGAPALGVVRIHWRRDLSQ